MSNPWVWDVSCRHGGRPGRDRAGRLWCPSCRRLEAKDKSAQKTREAIDAAALAAHDLDLLDHLED